DDGALRRTAVRSRAVRHRVRRRPLLPVGREGGLDSGSIAGPVADCADLFHPQIPPMTLISDFSGRGGRLMAGPMPWTGEPAANTPGVRVECPWPARLSTARRPAGAAATCSTL